MAAATSFEGGNRRLRVRAPKLGFEGVPKAWLAGSRAATQIANGVNLLFPAGERFFIRSVRHYMDKLSPELAADVRNFFGQEGRHAYAHERFFDTLREQGYDVDSILKRYERIAYDFIEPVSPPIIRLAVTVALEHFTAILAEDALTGDELQFAAPELRRLLEWHAVEELEHKAVAFDVLKEVSPGYAVRAAGMVIAVTVLSGFWIFCVNELMKQDGATLADCGREMKKLRKLAEEANANTSLAQPIATGVFWKGIKEYLRPGFHPNDRDHRELIAKTLERLKTEGVVAD